MSKQERRRYSDQDKATALASLAANGGNVNQTARDLGLPEPTLRSWARGRGVGVEIVDLQAHKKVDLADRLESIAHKLAGAIPGKIDEGSLQQTATSLAILIDKMQLLRGRPTAINEDVTDARDKLAHLVDRFATRTRTG